MLAQREKPTGGVLSVSPVEQDHIQIESILGSVPLASPAGRTWRVSRAGSLATALIAVRQAKFAVILCESSLGADSWKDLIAGAAGLMESSVLIVTSLHADEHLWAEALNLGVYDVLAKPFRQAELSRAVELGCMRWQRQQRDAGSPMHARVASC